jgi:hypothetical protein
MKLFIFSFLLLTGIFLYPINALAKPVYLKGWYCDASNAKYEGYIWYDEMHYTHFFYKQDLNSKKQKLTLDDAASFSFDNRFFYKINEVKISNGLWKTTKPQVFAEAIMEGKASLYRVFGSIQQPGTSVYGPGNM